MTDVRSYRGWLLLAGVPLVLFAVFYVWPVISIFRLSLDRFDPSAGIIPAFDPGFYLRFFADEFFLGVLLRTVLISAATTAICIPLAYPISFYVVQGSGWRRTFLLIVLLMPLVTSVIVVSYGWLIVLGQRGVLNTLLMDAGLISRPLPLMYSSGGIVIALVHVQLVFMVLSIAGSLRAIDPNLRRAARNLGASRWMVFRRIELPLTRPGLVTGSLLVFSLCMSAYAIPVMIGGARNKVLSVIIYQQSMSLLNWPFASAVAVILLATTCAVLFAARLLVRGR